MDWDNRQGKCEAFEVLMEDSVEGTLRADDAVRLERHLRECADCRQMLSEAQASRRLLQYGDAAPEASPGFSRIVMARIREAEAQSAAGQPGLLRSLVAFASRLAITATLALGVLIAYTAVAPPAPNSRSASMNAEERSGLFTDPVQQASTRDGFLRMVADTSHGEK